MSVAIPTTDGDFFAFYSERGLARLEFPGAIAAGKRRVLKVSGPARAWHALTTEALQTALTGRPPGELPPFDLSTGTDFQQRVWQALRDIPNGRTKSYGEIALAVGQPGGARAVGRACGANPVPVLIPCHRVLAAGQKLGGFSGGLIWKRKLLAREGLEFPGLTD